MLETKMDTTIILTIQELGFRGFSVYVLGCRDWGLEFGALAVQGIKPKS